jgi:TfoX/Sxy family transcriptional regulator of competence genes
MRSRSTRWSRLPGDDPVTENQGMAFDAALADRIRDLVRGQSGLTEKQMFGGLAFLVRGNMAISASGQGGVLVRVDPARIAELAARPHAEVAVMRGRAMDGWLRVDDDGVRTKPQLQRWVDEGVAYARSLPEKPSAPR